MPNITHRIEIERQFPPPSGEGLRFKIEIDQQHESGLVCQEMLLTYGELQKLVQFGKEFMTSCMARKSTHEWETSDE